MSATVTPRSAAALLLASLLIPVFSGFTSAAEPEARIEKLAVGELKHPLSIKATPSGDLVALDQRGPEDFAVVTFSPAGEKKGELRVPGEVKNPQIALADSKGNIHLVTFGTTVAHVLSPGGKVSSNDLKAPIRGVDLRRIGKDDLLLFLGDQKVGAYRISTTAKQGKRVVFSKWPARGALSEPRWRADGHIYAYASEENRIYHFDGKGKYIEAFGGGGPRPPAVGLAADCLGPHYDVDAQGNLYWTMGNYGALLKYTADGKTGWHFRGQENWAAPWTGPIHTLTGLALSGERAYVTDAGTNRITSFPLSLFDQKSPDVESINTRVYGWNFKLVSDTPYHLFRTDQAKLKAAFAPGYRKLNAAELEFRVFDWLGQSLPQGAIKVTATDDASFEAALPDIVLPKLGWYQVEAQVKQGSEVLVEQVTFVCRTDDDPRLPIPAEAVTGWHDLETHRMLGLGLHRFGGKPDALLNDLAPAIEAAERLQVPYFLQLTDPGDCTAENVKRLLAKYPNAPLLEIVNEPNLQLSVEDYVRRLKECTEAAKSVNPKIRILGPAQCGTELGWFENFLRQGAKYVDGVSFHTYERHNSMDPWHWGWKLARIRALVDQYAGAAKPLYQSEHGFLGDYHELMLRPGWQARCVFLEQMMLDRAGIDPAHSYYYYANFGGFRDFSAYLVTRDRELLPAALLTRSRAQRLGGMQFARAIDFGNPGNWLLLGSVYSGQKRDALVLINNGAWKPIHVSVEAGSQCRVFDAFGNAVEVKQDKTGRIEIQVGRWPVYVDSPHGAQLTARLADFGKDVSAELKAAVDDPAGQASTPRLFNGRLEFDFENEPERVGFLASPDKLPLELTLELPKARRLQSAVLYASYADNDKCTPLEYEVQVRHKGAWKSVDEVAVEMPSRTLLHGTIARLTWYDNPWIFVHQWEPIEADAVRFRFKKATFGQYPTAEFNEQIAKGGLRPRVELRELQVFAAD